MRLLHCCHVRLSRRKQRLMCCFFIIFNYTTIKLHGGLPLDETTNTRIGNSVRQLVRWKRVAREFGMSAGSVYDV